MATYPYYSKFMIKKTKGYCGQLDFQENVQTKTDHIQSTFLSFKSMDIIMTYAFLLLLNYCRPTPVGTDVRSGQRKNEVLKYVGFYKPGLADFAHAAQLPRWVA